VTPDGLPVTRSGQTENHGVGGSTPSLATLSVTLAAVACRVALTNDDDMEVPAGKVRAKLDRKLAAAAAQIERAASLIAQTRRGWQRVPSNGRRPPSALSRSASDLARRPM